MTIEIRSGIPEGLDNYEDNDDEETVIWEIPPDLPPGRVTILPRSWRRRDTEVDVEPAGSLDTEDAGSWDSPIGRPGIPGEIAGEGDQVLEETRVSGQMYAEWIGPPVMACPSCRASAVCWLPAMMQFAQTDGTTLECSSWFGGCGAGYRAN